MKRCKCVILLVFVCMICFGASTAGKLVFKTTGFSIQPLETEPLGHSYQAMSMLLPPSGGFAPNVNVQVQCFNGTIDMYAQISKKEFASLKMKLIKETKQGEDTIVFEYSGTFQARKLHWYAKAIATGKRVYLATATATEKQWVDVSDTMKACVDSLEVDKPQRGAEF